MVSDDIERVVSLPHIPVQDYPAEDTKSELRERERPDHVVEYSTRRLATSMSLTNPHILFMTADATLLKSAEAVCKKEGAKIDVVEDRVDVMRRLNNSELPYNIVLVDDSTAASTTPDYSLAVIHVKAVSSAEVIWITNGEREPGVAALKEGAFDYIDRSVVAEELPYRIKQIARFQKLLRIEREDSLFRTLGEVRRRLAQGKSDTELFQIITTGIHNIGYDRTRLYLLSEDCQCLIAKADFGMGDGFRGRELPLVDCYYMRQLLENPRPQAFRRNDSGVVPFEDFLEKQDLNEWASVPLMLNQEVVGKISVDNKNSGRRIFDEDLDLLLAFASEAVEAIERANESMRMEALQRAIEVIARLADRKKLLQAITNEAMKLLGTRDSGLYGYYPERQELLLIADHRHPEFIGNKRLKVGDGMAGQLVQSLKPFEIIPDYAMYEHQAETFAGEGFGAVIGVLLTVQRRVLGVLYVEDTPGRAFTEDDARLLCLFGERAAAVLSQWEQKDRLQALLDSSPLGIIAATRRGNVTRFNKAAKRILKYDESEVEDKLTVFDLYADKQEPRLIGRLLKELNGVVSNYETEVKAKDGEIIPILHSSTWVHDSAGERIGSVGFFEDLRAIKEKERRFEIILRASNLIATARNIRNGLNALARMMVSLIGGNFCRILLIDEGANTLVPMGAFRASGNHEDAWSPTGGGPTPISDWPQLPQILRDGRPAVRHYSDPVMRPDLIKLAKRLGLRGPIHSLLLVPLNVGERTIGLLHVGDDTAEGGTVFDDPEIVIAAAVAAQTAVLVDRERARLRLEALFKASTALVSPDDPEQVLLDVVGRAREAAGASSVSLVQIDEHGRAINHVTAGIEPSHDIASIMRHDGNSIRVWKKGEPVLVEDTSEPRYNFNPKMRQAARVGAAVCLPVNLQGSALGVMWVHYGEPRSFREDEIERLQLYVNQAALAYDNSRRITELKRIREAAKALAGATTQEEVLKEIVVSACYALSADSAVIWFYDGRNFVPEISESHGIPEDLWEQFRSKGPRPYGTAHKVIERGILEIADVEDSNELGETTQALLSSIGARRFLGIALRGDSSVGKQAESSQDVLGVLYVNYKQPRSFRPEERELILSFANQAAFALKKALLLVQMGRLLGQVETARKTAQRVAEITTRGDLSSALYAATNGTRDALACDVVSIYVYYPEDNRLSSPFIVGAYEPEKADLLKTVPPHSMVFEVLNSSDIIAVEDITKSDLFKSRPFAAREGIRSCAATSLRIGSERVGVMFVNYRTPHVFSEYEIANIKLFSSQAAIAIHNTKLVSRTKKDLEDRENLLAFSSQLFGTPGLGETMRRAVTFAAGRFGVEYCSLVLPDESRRLRFERGFGWPKEMEGNSHLGRGKKSQSGYTIEKQEPVFVEDFAAEERFNIPAIVHEYRLKSSLSVPVVVDQETTGAMLLHTATKRRFGEADTNLLSLIGNQTGIAIRSARQLEATEKARLQIEALYEASKAITPAMGGAERETILEGIVRRAVEYLQPQAVLGTLHTYESETDELTLVTAYPMQHFTSLVAQLGRRRPLRGNERTGFKRGVIGRAVLQGKTQIASNKDPDYIELHSDTRSELAVPLKEENKVIGVLNVESNRELAFDAGDQRMIEAMAELALMVIGSARNQRIIAARTALAFMGLSSNTWYHGVRTKAVAIRDYVELVKQSLLRRSVSPPDELDEIDMTAARIIDFPRLRALSYEEGLGSFPIDAHVTEWLRKRKRRIKNTSSSVKIMHELHAEGASVKANPIWLNEALNVLLDNAVEAVVQSSVKVVTVATDATDEYIVIKVSDTGTGISEQVKPKLLEEPILRDDARRWGLGLLMARFIVQVYRGDITIGSSTSTGTTMVVRLPLDRKKE